VPHTHPMPRPYVYERQTEYWTNAAIESSLQSMGFTVRCFPITQVLENKVAVDAIFSVESSTVKMFGLQHKTMYYAQQSKSKKEFGPSSNISTRSCYRNPGRTTVSRKSGR
jgi:hypothetical protein